MKYDYLSCAAVCQSLNHGSNKHRNNRSKISASFFFCASVIWTALYYLHCICMLAMLLPILAVIYFYSVTSFLPNHFVFRKKPLTINSLYSAFNERRWISPEGLNISILESNFAPTQSPALKKPILFVHGSFHSAWCFENFINFFSNLGHKCYAVNLRGTSPTGLPKGNWSSTAVKSIKVEEHVRDLSFVIQNIYSQDKERPIVVSHSFGGLLLMKLLESNELREMIFGAVFVCSIPPSGNGAMSKRFLFKTPLLALKIIWAFVFRGVTTNSKLCREIFFDDSVSDDEIGRYMVKFKEDSTITVDFASLAGVLPSVTSMSSDGAATWLQASPFLRPFRLVFGAGEDRIVDWEGVQETARYLGVQPTLLPTMCHDVMLSADWQEAARAIASKMDKAVHSSDRNEINSG